MYCTEESTCDTVWTLWRPRSHSALPVVIRCPENCASPRYAPATVQMSAGFVKILKKMKQLLWQTKTSFLNFRPKLEDCMFKLFS